MPFVVKNILIFSNIPIDSATLRSTDFIRAAKLCLLSIVRLKYFVCI